MSRAHLEAVSPPLAPPLAPPSVVALRGEHDATSALTRALAVLRAADEACVSGDADQVLEVATRLARERLGLQQVAFYVRDTTSDGFLMRGSWAADGDGAIVDQHELSHSLSIEDVGELLALPALGAVCVHRRGPSSRGLALTPLVVGGALLGVMYNDTPAPHTPGDANVQAVAAVFCNFIALLYVARRDSAPWKRLPSASQKSALVQRILVAIDGNLPVRGGDLARELGVSPGHLARAFKREMGVSLVEYRNKKRIERFKDVLQKTGRQGSLKEAAFAAGFGSYAQFHRIYHKFVGSPPRTSFAAHRDGPQGDQGSPLAT